MTKDERFRTAKLVSLAIAATTTFATVAASAAAPTRVAVLGPNDAPILERLQRNVASMKLDGVHATVSVCTRDVVTRLVDDMQAEMAICTDGDQISVWVRSGDRMVLKDAVVVQSADVRAQELAAARAAMALGVVAPKEARSERAKEPPPPPGSFTITANGSGATVTSNDATAASPALSPSTTKDAPATPPPAVPRERIAPRLVLGVGPALAASRDGNSFALSAEAEIGVSRYVALIPWIQFVPANRPAEAPAGSASFRPTIFGLGFGIPILRPSSVVVPRIGAGYGILWMHVAPDSATAGASMRAPEDLLAPLMYATTAFSVKVAENFRVAAEGMLGVSSHDMVVRIGGESAAHWGVPVASAALRGEWVLQ
ncbi:MAG: hypothetical protein K0S65_337 [Labilithrix sp.]|nr:hypothetical protein [Labilithrix sp.]